MDVTFSTVRSSEAFELFWLNILSDRLSVTDVDFRVNKEHEPTSSGV